MPSSSEANHQGPVRRHYETDANIRIRQEIHDKYTFPRVDFADWVLGNIRWKGGETVLDVGCGNGQYYYPLQFRNPDTDAPPIRYHGIDISPGILRSHPAAGAGWLSVADAVSLPFAGEAFDVVMANHMLFYVSDIEQALLEFRRVLKPGGKLVVATNSIYSMALIQALFRKAIALLSRTSGVQAPIPHSDLFSLENGLLWLKRHFYAVMRCDLPGMLVVNTIDPLIDYMESTRDLRESQLPPDVAWEDLMAIVRQQVIHLISTYGEIGIEKLSGVLVATDDGDFVQEFITIRNQTRVNTPTTSE